MSDKLTTFNPQMLQILQGSGLALPSQDREFTTNDSRLSLWNNARKAKRLEEIENSRSLAVSKRTEAIRSILNLMYDMALAGDRMYHEKYTMDHERRMMDLAEKMQEAQITKVERETMLIELKLQTGMSELKMQNLENELKSLSINKRIQNGDY